MRRSLRLNFLTGDDHEMDHPLARGLEAIARGYGVRFPRDLDNL